MSVPHRAVRKTAGRDVGPSNFGAGKVTVGTMTTQTVSPPRIPNHPTCPSWCVTTDHDEASDDWSCSGVARAVPYNNFTGAGTFYAQVGRTSFLDVDDNTWGNEPSSIVIWQATGGDPCLTAGEARALGQALIAAADDLDKE